MSDWVGSLGGSRRSAEIAGWGIAAAAVVTAHAAGGYWLLNAAPPPRPPAGAEMVIEIALEAAAPPAPEAEPEAIPDIPMLAAPDLPLSQDEPEILPEQDLIEPMVEPEHLSDMLPDELPLFEPPPEPLPEPELPVIETAEAVLAPALSPKPPPRPEKKQRTTTTPPAPRNTAPAKIEATKVAEVASAPAVRSGVSAEKAEANWRSEVNARVGRHMARWANKTRQAHKLRVQIEIDGAGRVLGVQIDGSTGDAAADASLRAHAGRITGLPITPDKKSRNLRIPVTLKR